MVNTILIIVASLIFLFFVLRWIKTKIIHFRLSFNGRWNSIEEFKNPIELTLWVEEELILFGQGKIYNSLNGECILFIVQGAFLFNSAIINIFSQSPIDITFLGKIELHIKKGSLRWELIEEGNQTILPQSLVFIRENENAFNGQD